MANPSSDDSIRIGDICAGVHGFYTYATNHWIDHLQLITQRDNTDALSNTPVLSKALKGLLSKHDNLLQMNGKPAIPSADTNIKLQRHPSLSICNDLDVQSFVSHLPPMIYDPKRHVNLSQAPNDVPDEHQLDLTLYPLVHDIYTASVRRLLNHGSEVVFPYLSLDAIARFRRTYGDTAFCCRQASCSRRSTGFPTATDRDEHEKTHRAQFMCQESDCTYSSIRGFASTRALRKHVEKFHMPSLPPLKLQENAVERAANMTLMREGVTQRDEKIRIMQQEWRAMKQESAIEQRRAMEQMRAMQINQAHTAAFSPEL